MNTKGPAEGAATETPIHRTAKSCLDQAEKYFKSGKLPEARVWLQRMVDIEPNEFSALAALGNLCFQLGDMKAATDAFQRAAGRRPDDPAIHVLLAASAVKCGEVQVFEQALGRALALDSNNAPALQLLATLNLEQGKLAEAARIYFQILKQDQSNVEATLGLGVCFFKQGNRDMARQSFERVLSLQPRHALAAENLRILEGAQKWVATFQSKYPYIANAASSPEGLRVILGVGRSGTSWVGKVLSKASTPTRFISEALFHVDPKLPYQQTGDHTAIGYNKGLDLAPLLSAYQLLASRQFDPSKLPGLERNDPDWTTCLVKEVHALLGSEALLRQWKVPALFILRDPVYILDSLFAAQTLQTSYLDHEAAAVREAAFLSRFAGGAEERIAKALAVGSNLPPRAKVIVDKLICIHLLQRMFVVLAGEFPHAKVFAYEDFCERPIETFQAAAQALALPWDDAMALHLRESMSADAVSAADPYATKRDTAAQRNRGFKFLSTEEIALCRATLAAISGTGPVKKPALAPKPVVPPTLAGNDPLSGLEASGVWQKGKPLRLHLGCGEQHFDGYVNIDYPPANHNVMTIKADAYANILELNFPPNSVDEIRLHHVFEHFNRVTALAMLMKWHGWLKEGGLLRIETPDLLGSAKMLASPAAPYKFKMAAARHLAGDQAASWGYHLDHWFPERYERTLTRLGFGPVKIISSSWPHEPHLANVEVFGLKQKRATEEQILAADELLWESTVAEAERPTYEVWRQQLRALLNEGATPQAPINAITPAARQTTASTQSIEKNVTMLVVSKDRPLQLAATLASWKRHCLDPGTTSVQVLYKASGSRMASLYRQLMREYPEVAFVAEKNFRQDYLALLGKLEYVLFVVDDTVFTRDYTTAQITGTLKAHPEILGFSMRLGRNTTYCYSMNQAQRLPAFESMADGQLKFRWPGMDCDFGYALEVSSSIYRSKEMLALLERINFTHPNTLEAMMFEQLGLFSARQPYLACWEYSGAFSIPANKVQSICDNRAGANAAYSAESLAALFTQGQRIQTQAFDGFLPNACHQEMELKTAPETESVPLVSVIVPCYKQAQYLPEAVASVVAQTFTDWELIIVNDGSPDDTSAVARELIKKYSGRRVRLLEKKNGGLADARNAGINAALGAYILPLDSDDKIAPAMLEKTVAVLEKNPGVSIVYTDIEHFGAASQIIQAAEFDFKKLCVNNQLNYCSLYRREAWEMAGGYNPNMTWGYEDWDFWIGCGERGLVAQRIPGALLKYRVKDSSMYTNALVHDRELRARIVLNHPALYDTAKVAEARAIWSPAPKVSVIVPTYNRPERLVTALGSILNQTFTDYEIIVVNDAGSDVENAVAALKSSQPIICLRHQTNKGLAAARNTGLEAARGKYIAYLDDDDVYYPDHLQTLVEFLESHPGTVAYTDADCAFQDFVDGQWNTTRRQVMWSQDWDNNKILVDNFVPNLCLMHERACLQKAGKFDESLSRHEDWDLLIRLSRHFAFAHIRKVTCEFVRRQDKSSMSVQGYARFLETMTRIHAKYAEHAKEHPEILQAQAAKRAELQRLAAEESTAVKIKVGVLTADDEKSACALLRLVGPLQYLHSKGRIEYLSLCDKVNGQTVLNEKNFQQAQVIVVQRGMPAHVPFAALRAAIKKSSAKIVFELDDALTLLPADNPHNGYFDSIRPQIEEYLRNSDLITVSTPRLKEIYSAYNENIEVLPNTVDTDMWLAPGSKAEKSDKFTILFSGTLTHQSDLSLVEPAIERIINEFGERVEFLFWGNLPARLAPRPQIKGVARFTRNYREYVDLLKSLKIDLAIVPLEDVAFNQAKSNIKWLEYSACKIPAIFSDIEPYNKSVEHQKTGWLVPNTVDAWYEAIKQLLQNGKLRRQIAETAHQTVLAKHSLATNAEQWVRAYEGVLNSTDKTSIIIPTFNNLQLTRNCLAALQKNTPPQACEVIVVDNASTDGTIAFLKGEEQAGRVRVLFNHENAGFARACNQGARIATGRNILFLNNDTEVEAGWLTALADAIRRPGVGIAGAKLLYADGRIQHAGIEFVGNVPDHPHRHAPANAPEVNQFRELDMVTGACLMIRRDLFLELAGFDESYRNGVEDIDLCLRVRAAGRKVVYEPKSVVRHLEGQSAGRFNHVSENLKLFFARWGNSFDRRKHFVELKPAKIIPAQASVLLAQKVAVAWEGSFLDFGSLSNINREVTGRLKSKAGVNLCLVGNATGGAAEFKEFARQLKPGASKETQVTVRHQWPPNWSKPAHGSLVIIQPWEFGSLPREWVKWSENVDEFWVPSNYVRDVYTRSGVNPKKVVVIPNGIDAAQYRPGIEPLKLATNKSLKFLFVGGTIKRKGPDVLLRAYLNAFTAADDVCLVIKDFGGDSYYKGQTFEKEIAAARSRPNAPEILYLNSELAPADMPRLYAACQCLVHPYRGEGFGMPVLEAMACGLSVVVTQGGSTDDFVTPECGWFIASQKRSIGPTVGNLSLATDGWCLEPDAADLCAKLKYIYAHPDEAKARGARAATVAKNYRWDGIVETMTDRLRHVAASVKTIPQRSMPKKIVKIELPPVAKLGHLASAREALGRRQYRAAWDQAAAALKVRPYHPEAWLILAESAQGAGARAQADGCLEIGRKLTPHWKPLQSFAKKKNRSGGKPAGNWPAVPGLADSPKLSVCLIVKNEEKFLGRCLESVRGLAHQIIVVDTGSTDRTLEIARQHNAEVHSFAWTDDFSAARNEALKYATGDWVLSLDADEELLPEHRETILQEMNTNGVIGYRLPIVNHGREDEGCGYVPRLFRNAPGLFWVGRVHEQIFSSLEARAHEWGLENRLGRSTLLHHGYSKEIVDSRNKKERNLRLLKLAVEELPGELNLMMNLGLELIRSGDVEGGLEKYRTAFRMMSEMPANDVTPEFRESLLTQFTRHLLAAGRFNEIIELWQNPYPQANGLTASQHFMLGVARMELKQHAGAADEMRQCLTKRGQPALSPVNPEILRSGPRHCLAVSLAGLGQDNEAEKAFREALAEEPKSRALRSDFAKFQYKRGRRLETLKLANELVAEDARDLATWLFGGEVALSEPEFSEFAQDWTSQAVRNFPEESAVLLQRAEALLMSEHAAGSLALWTRAAFPDSPRHLAALTLCELLQGTCRRYFPAAAENQVSQEFLKWYRRLIKFNARNTVKQINDRIEELRTILPTAAGTLNAALKKAEVAMAI